MRANREPFDVFEYKILWAQLSDQSHEMKHELIAWIVQRPPADQRESLARRPSAEDIDVAFANFCAMANILTRKIDDARTNGRCVRKIVMMDCTVNWIYFHGRGDIKARLLERQRKSTGAGE